MKSLEKISKIYNGIAIIFFNTVILLVLINLGLFFLFWIKDNYFISQNNVISEKYNIALDSVYPSLTEEEINILLDESWKIKLNYEPFTQFREEFVTGKYVNNDRNGFRHSINQGPWPPNPDHYTIFLFGGSTTYGRGVPDNHTIASYLQELHNSYKNVYVYNFGQGSYYSSQERALFIKLLVSGYVPDRAIFIDGLNEFYYNDNLPALTKALSNFVKQRNKQNVEKEHISKILFKIPMFRAANSLKKRMKISPNNKDNVITIDNISEETYNNKTVINNVITTYLNNKNVIEALGEYFGVKITFVWQPIPLYNYNIDNHLFAGKGFGKHTFSKYGYLEMEKVVKENNIGDNFVWCADIQKGINEPLYVDSVHYSAKMSKMTAKCIFDFISE